MDAQQSAEITTQFLAAAASGDVESLIGLLAPDVAWIADGGGKVSAARKPVVGAHKVARAIVGLVRKGVTDMRIESIICNSGPAVVVYSGDRVDLVIAVEVVDGKIANFYAVRNPDKLAALAVPREISR